MSYRYYETQSIQTSQESARQVQALLHVNAILEVISDAVMTTDIDAKITYMNRAAESLTGIKRHQAVGQPSHDIFRVIDISTRKTRKNLAKQVIRSNSVVPMHNSALLISQNGQECAIEDSATPLYDESNNIVGALIVFHDARFSSEATAKLSYLAQHDTLTGLLNRYAFSEQFERAAALARRHQKKMVMLFIDLDNFKDMNDTLGHSNGDLILKKLGQNILSCVRVTDSVCRYGGDEFVVLLSDIEHPEQAFAIVDKVREAAAALMDIKGRTISLKMSIGVSTYPDNGVTLEALLPHADAAMYRVKSTKNASQTPRKSNRSKGPSSD